MAAGRAQNPGRAPGRSADRADTADKAGTAGRAGTESLTRRAADTERGVGRGAAGGTGPWALHSCGCSSRRQGMGSGPPSRVSQRVYGDDRQRSEAVSVAPRVEATRHRPNSSTNTAAAAVTATVARQTSIGQADRRRGRAASALVEGRWRAVPIWVVLPIRGSSMRRSFSACPATSSSARSATPQSSRESPRCASSIPTRTQIGAHNEDVFRRSGRRGAWGVAVAVLILGAGAAALSFSSPARAATALCSDQLATAPTGPAVVAAASTGFGRVLVVGSGAYAGCSVYVLTSDQLHALSGAEFACSDSVNLRGFNTRFMLRLGIRG